MSREKEKKMEEGKGFAGLSLLVSNVDTTPPPVATEEPAATAPGAESAALRTTQSQTSEPQNTYQGPAQSSASNSLGEGILVFGAAAAIVMLWLIAQVVKNSTTSPPDYSPPTPTVQTATPNHSPPAEPQVPSRPQESMPPVGQDLVFSTAQIIYCLAEDIRIEGAKLAVNNHVDSDVNRFNLMVADYNSRCGTFRYHSGALESARQEIELYRAQLSAEGRMRFLRENPDQTSTSNNHPQVSRRDFGTETYETSYDCTKAKSIPENLVCHDPVLAASDRELAATFELAKKSIPDISTLRQRAIKQWNFREKNCKDRACVAAWYEYQKTVWAKILQTGDANAEIDQ